MKITLRKDFKIKDKPWTLCVPADTMFYWSSTYHYYLDFEQALPWVSLAVSEQRVRKIMGLDKI